MASETAKNVQIILLKMKTLSSFSCKRSIPKKFIDRLSDKIDNRIKIEKNLTGVRLWIMDSKIKFVTINLMKTVNME